MISITLKLFSLLLCLVAVRSEKPLAQGIICERACLELPGTTISCALQQTNGNAVRFITRADALPVKHIPDTMWRLYSIPASTSQETLCEVVQAGDDFHKAKRKNQCHKWSHNDAGDNSGHPLGLWSGGRVERSSDELMEMRKGQLAPQKRFLPFIIAAIAAAIAGAVAGKKRTEFYPLEATDPQTMQDLKFIDALDKLPFSPVVNPELACNLALRTVCSSGKMFVCSEDKKCCYQPMGTSACEVFPMVPYHKCLENLSTMITRVK